MVAILFALDFANGIRLGEHNVGFSPIYRMRQSLSIALSRLHTPPAHGYLAYGSVVQVFNDNGFAIFSDEKGPHLAAADWRRIWNDGAEMNRILKAAAAVPIDPNVPPQILGANELGYADFAEISFRLFGVRLKALYYFYFALLALACVCYLLEFWRSPFALFLLVIFLAEEYFLQYYAVVWGTELNTIYNSRLFSGLSLLPAAHIFFVLWFRRSTPTPSRVGLVLIQAGLLAFLVTCRVEVMWQVGMILSGAGLLGLHELLARNGRRLRSRIAQICRQLWPAPLVALVLAGSWTYINSTLDARYAGGDKTHVFWHAVLSDMIANSPYLGGLYITPGLNVDDGDQIGYSAVITDLNRRHDLSSPIAYFDQGLNRINIDLTKSWAEYDKLAKHVVLRIIREHPDLVARGLLIKLREQVNDYYDAYNPVHDSFHLRYLTFPMLACVMAALLCGLARGFEIDVSTIGSGFVAGILVLLCALATPLVTPHFLAIGTLFTYLAAFVVVASFCVAPIVAVTFHLGAFISRSRAAVQS
ncbi:MAG: hypothetical protein JO128_14725 [Alphaproteobacteria bacterium]|nr:hypothetical protein [Alphaproteobacteria bacterium]